MRDNDILLELEMSRILPLQENMELSHAFAFNYNKNIQRWNEISKLFS